MRWTVGSLIAALVLFAAVGAAGAATVSSTELKAGWALRSASNTRWLAALLWRAKETRYAASTTSRLLVTKIGAGEAAGAGDWGAIPNCVGEIVLFADCAAAASTDS